MASKITMKVETEKHSRGRWRQSPQVGQEKVKSLEAALGVLGPEDIGAKEQIQEALRRAKEGRQAVRVKPDIVKAEAVAKVERLQKALDALGGLGGPEVDAIKRALKKAQEVARERPIAELIKECKELVHRAFNQAHLKVKDGLGDRDRIVGGQSRPIDTVGSTSSASWRSCCCRRGPSVDVATNGESVARGTRFVVSGFAPESCGEGEALVWGRSTRCKCHSPHPRSPSGSRGVDEQQELRIARRTRVWFTRSCCMCVNVVGTRSFSDGIDAQGGCRTGAMDLQNGPGTRMSALIDAANAKRRCLDGGQGVPGCL